MKKHNSVFFILLFLIFFFLLFWKVIAKGYVLGPFDFLNAFYDPFRSISWKNTEIANSVSHYKNYLLSDVVLVIWPQKLLAIDLFKSGKFPLWDPYILNGSPLFANVQSSVLYPLNFLFFIFGKITAFNIYILSQFVMGFGFMFLFLKKIGELGVRNKEEGNINFDIFAFFGAMSFAFCSFMVGWSTWGTLGHAILWLPLILYFIEKYFETKKIIYGCLISICLTVSIFAGHTQTTTMVYLISFIYILINKTESQETGVRSKAIQTKYELFGFIFLSLLLGAIQLVPSIEMYMNSSRELASNTKFYYDQTLYFSSYLSGIFPDIFGNPVTRNWWGKLNYVEAAIYFGTTGFYFMIYSLLSALGNWKKNVAVLFGIVLVIVGVILSTQNPISKLIFDLSIPLFSSNTFARYSMIYIFGGIVLSTFGFSKLINDLNESNFKIIKLNNIFFIIFLGVVGLFIILKILPQDYIANIDIVKRNILLPGLILSVLIITTFVYSNKKININYLNILVITLLLLELFRYTDKFLPIVSSDLFYPNHKSINKLQELTKNGKYYGYLPNNINVMYRIYGFDGGEPLYNKNLAEIASLSKSNIPQIEGRGALGIGYGKNMDRVFDLLSIKYFVDSGDSFRNDMALKVFGGDYKKFDERFRLIDIENNFHVYNNNYALADARLVYSYIVPNSRQQMFDSLVDENFDISKNVFLEKNIGKLVIGKPGAVTKIFENETEKKYFVDGQLDGLLVLSDIYYPGWRVYIDGEEQEMLKVNNAFMGVKLREGKNNVQFIYNSNTIKLAAIMSFVGLYIWSFLTIFAEVEIWKKK